MAHKECIKYNPSLIEYKIHRECEGRIVKSVPRITVWHVEACRVMTNCDLEGQLFLSHSHTNDGFFSISYSPVNTIYSISN